MRGTRPAVEAIGDSVEVILTVDREVSALGQILAQQTVGVLACATLPGAVRVAEIDLHAGICGEFLVARHFLAGARQLGSPLVLPHEGMLPDGLLSFRFPSSFLSWFAGREAPGPR
jgi:hypothetical protein